MYQELFRVIGDVKPPRYHVGQEVLAENYGRMRSAIVWRISWEVVKVGRKNHHTWAYWVRFRDCGTGVRRYAQEMRSAVEVSA